MLQRARIFKANNAHLINIANFGIRYCFLLKLNLFSWNLIQSYSV